MQCNPRKNRGNLSATMISSRGWVHLMGWVNKKRLQEEFKISYALQQNSPRQVCSSRGVIKADDNGQATNHAGSSIPIIEHAQIDIHAVHLRELIWPTTNDRGVTCFARDAVRTTRRKTNIQESFLKHAMQSKKKQRESECNDD